MRPGMPPTNSYRPKGEVVHIRYVLSDGRIEMCWPCRVIEDSHDSLALFIAAGTKYKAEPKRTAAQKRASPSPPVPRNEYVWRSDTLRLMFPGRSHSVWLFWESREGRRSFSKYFVNLEEPFRRTAIGFDTQDHTLDVLVQPDGTWAWRDETEFDNHVREGFFTPALVQAVRSEAARVIDDISRGVHPCLKGWSTWTPDPRWKIPDIAPGWETVAASLWEKRTWAYGVSD
jgi:predicted RNA-binding protein associated with RNAse of E/G family